MVWGLILFHFRCYDEHETHSNGSPCAVGQNEIKQSYSKMHRLVK